MRVLLVPALVVATLLLAAPRPAAASASDAACMEDSCQACAMGGTCYLNMLSQCRDPACFLLGIGGGLLGAVGGGLVGPLVLTLPGIALYGTDPATAVIGAVFVGAGLGCVAGGLPGMMCGTALASSLRFGQFLWPWEQQPAPKKKKRRGRGRKR